MDKSHFQNLNQSKQNFDENSEILYDLTGIQVLWLLYTKKLKFISEKYNVKIRYNKFKVMLVGKQ